MTCWRACCASEPQQTAPQHGKLGNFHFALAWLSRSECPGVSRLESHSAQHSTWLVSRGGRLSSRTNRSSQREGQLKAVPHLQPGPAGRIQTWPARANFHLSGTVLAQRPHQDGSSRTLKNPESNPDPSETVLRGTSHLHSALSLDPHGRAWVAFA